MARKLTRTLRNFVTQFPAADSGIALDFKTGLPLDTEQGFLIRTVEFALSPSEVKAWANADISLRVVLRRGKNDGNAYAISNVRVINSWEFVVTAQTSSTDVVIPTTFQWNAPPNLVVADEWLSIGLTSAGTGQKNTVSFVINGELTNLTPEQVLQLRAWGL